MNVVKLARWTQPSFLKLAASSSTPQFLAIPYSHYCEMAAWTLSKSNTSFKSYWYAPGEHVLPTLSVRIGDPNATHLATSSRTQSIQKPSSRPNPTSVPLLILPSGKVLADSWDIASHALPSSASIDPALLDILDNSLAPLSRQFVYIYLLNPAHRSLWNDLIYSVASPAFSLAWRLFAGDVVTNKMTKMFQSTNATANAKCIESLRESFGKVSAFIEDNAEPYIGGSSPSIADYAIASLASPAILPAKYCGGEFNELFERLMQESEEAKRLVEEFRKTPAGVHCLKMYELHR